MEVRTAGETVLAGAGVADAFALAACGEDEQALSANKQRASAQGSLGMVFLGLRRTRGVDCVMLTRGRGRNRGMQLNPQDVSH